MIDHDRLFKELLTTFFVEFVALFLPELSLYLQPDTLEFLDKEVFTDVTSGERGEVDLLVKAKFRDQDAFFLVHVENQAKPQAEFAKRMFRYFARLHEKFDLPIYPVALFSYDAPQRPEPDEYEVAFPDLSVLNFRFRTIQLNRLSWRDYVSRPNPVASALMATMQIAPEDRPRVKLECLRLLATLRLDPAKMQLISGFVDTYLHLNEAEERAFRADIAAVLPPEQETVMEIVTSWMKQGLQQGKETIVLRQLQHRFGALSPELQERIHTLSSEQLEDLAEALLDFKTLSEVDAWLAAHA